MAPTMLSCIVLGVLSSPSHAWSPPASARTTSRPARRGGHRPTTAPGAPRRRPRAPSALSLSATPLPPALSSAYDPALPAALVGEAVRAALRSDRGVCFDHTADRYPAAGAADGDGGLLASVVALRGTGARAFVDAKFSRSVPQGGSGGGAAALSPTTTRVRTGRAFETAYLTPKGRVLDRVLVAAFPPAADDDAEDEATEDDAFLVTSPGHGGTRLHDALAPRVFPMDAVALTAADPRETRVLTLACASLRDARTSFRNNVLELLAGGAVRAGGFEFPAAGACHHYRAAGGAGATTDAYVMEHTFLSPEICHGYTLLLREGAGGGDGGATTLADRIWDRLTAEDNDVGPVGVGAREYEDLRVEAGLPGYGHEMTGDGPKKGRSRKRDGEDAPAAPARDEERYYAKANPFELHLQDLVDTEKGCYQGQEGVAAVLNNKRGPPRQLYQATFRDADNDFDGGDGGGFGLLTDDAAELGAFRRQVRRAEAPPHPNETRQPRPGDDVYVLGSDGSNRIPVGKITSVAQPNGTGEAETVALVLVRRPTQILNAIKEQGLELPRWWDDWEDDDDDEGGGLDGVARRGLAAEEGGSGLMPPPPLDPLHNLEIVVGDSYTVGRLMSVPSRRGRGVAPGSGDTVATLLDYADTDPGAEGPAYFGYVGNSEADAAESVASLDPAPPSDDGERSVEEDDDEVIAELLARAEEEAAGAAAAASAAAAEAQRKEDKMNKLKARAEAAMAARRKKKDAGAGEEAAAAAADEAQRKEDKMKMLKARAEAAMAARRQQKSSG